MSQTTDYFTSQWYFADLVWRLESVPLAYHISSLAADLFAGAHICSKFPSNKPTIKHAYTPTEDKTLYNSTQD